MFTGRIKTTFVNTVYKIIDCRLLLTCFYYHFIVLNIRGQEKGVELDYPRIVQIIIKTEKL